MINFLSLQEVFEYLFYVNIKIQDFENMFFRKTVDNINYSGNCYGKLLARDLFYLC